MISRITGRSVGMRIVILLGSLGSIVYRIGFSVSGFVARCTLIWISNVVVSVRRIITLFLSLLRVETRWSSRLSFVGSRRSPVVIVVAIVIATLIISVVSVVRMIRVSRIESAVSVRCVKREGFNVNIECNWFFFFFFQD